MNKNLLFFCLITLNINYISLAQVTDTVVITAKADSNSTRYSESGYGKVTVTTYHPMISEYPEYNFTKIIDGRIPGLQTTNGGGQPGSSAQMLVRGMSSLSDNNAPFIVLDSIPYYGDLSSINTNDIANILLVKDAVATFQFGNRGGNGILYINTKRGINRIGNEHKPSLEVNAKFGVTTQAISDYNTVGTKDFYETMYTAIQNAGLSQNVVDYVGGYNAYHLNGVGDSLQDEYLIDPATGKLNSSAQLKYQDSWRKEMRRIGIRQSYDIASSARNSKGGYYFSAGYLNDKGYIQQTGFTKYSVLFNGDYKLLNWLKFGLKTQATTSKQDNADPGLFKSSQLTAPVYPVYYRNSNDEKEKDPITGIDKFDWGSLIQTPNSSIGDRRYYPNSNDIALLYLDDHSNKTYMYIVNPYLEISFLKGFTYTADLSYNSNEANGYDYYNSIYGLYIQNGGAEEKTVNTLNTRTFIHRLTWDKEIDKHHLTLTAGNEYFRQKIADSSAFHNLNNPSFPTISAYGVTLNNKGYFSNLAYGYNQKYLLFAGFRRDNTLMTESHWVNNWAVGAAYVISQEGFMKDITWINQLKLKANYGTQGRYFPSYSQINMPFKYYPTMGVSQTVLPDKGNQLNIGIEGSLFRYWLSFEANIYTRNSAENILSPDFNPTQFTALVSPFHYNNKGIELSVYTTNIQNKNFTWSTVFMLTHNKNTIESLPEGRDSIITQSNRLYKKGSSMADFYLIEYAGVDPNNGNALYYGRDGNGNEIKTTDFINAIETNRKNFGSAFPSIYGSLTNSFTYKNLDFSIQVNYSVGGKYYDQVYQELMSNGSAITNWSTDILNSWTPANTNTDVPKVDVGNPVGNITSSRFLKSASYLNIANVYLGYSFNEAKIKKAKMKSLKVYLTASNLWMFAANKGMNPQGSFYGTPGYVYLPARSVMLGLNVGI